MSNKDKDLAYSSNTKTPELTEKNNKFVHRNIEHNKNTNSTSQNKPKDKEIFSKDNSSGKKEYDNEKLFPSEPKEKNKKITPEIEFNTDHGEGESFISTLKNKAKELASKVGLTDDKTSNHDSKKSNKSN